MSALVAAWRSPLDSSSSSCDDSEHALTSRPTAALTAERTRRPQSQTHALARQPALDGLRGAAVAAVLLFHAEHLRGGYLGVDAFFVLSGFLITTLLVSEHARAGRVHLAGFWARRARRLLPALFLLLLGVALYAVVWAAPSELARLRSDTWWTLAYAANWHQIVGGHSYWDLFRAPSALEHTWSLAIEEQFYLVWPLVVAGVLATRRGLRTLELLCIGGAAGLGALMVGGSLAGWDQSTLYLMTFTRAPALLIGAALAVAFARRGSFALSSARARGTLEAAAVAAGLGLAWTWARLDGNNSSLYRGRLLLCGIAVAIVIAAAMQPGSPVVGRVLRAPPLVGLGVISYGVYLWHWPVDLVVTEDRTGVGGWWLVALRIAIAVAIAIVSYVAVERPVRRGYTPPRLTLAGALVAPLVVALAIVPATAGAYRSGVVARAKPGDGTITNYCSIDHLVPPLPRRVAEHGPRVMLVGDSVGCFIGAELERNAPRYGVTALNRAELGCLLARPSAGRYPGGGSPDVRDACADHWPEAVSWFHPRVVVVMVGGLWDYQMAIGGGRWAYPCDPGFADWYASTAARSLAVLASGGARVVVVAVPHQPKVAHIGVGVAIPPVFNEYVDCIDGALAMAVARVPHATEVDLNPLVCPQLPCLDELHGVVLRPDGRHFQGPSATIVADWLIPRVLAASGVRVSPTG